jgi:hypothetical protein
LRDLGITRRRSKQFCQPTSSGPERRPRSGRQAGVTGGE